MIGSPLEGRLSAGSLGRKEEAGAHVLLGVPMGQVFGKKLGRSDIQYFLMPFSLWEMV